MDGCDVFALEQRPSEWALQPADIDALSQVAVVIAADVLYDSSATVAFHTQVTPHTLPYLRPRSRAPHYGARPQL